MTSAATGNEAEALGDGVELEGVALAEGEVAFWAEGEVAFWPGGEVAF